MSVRDSDRADRADQADRTDRPGAAEGGPVDAALADAVVPLVPGLAARLRHGIEVLDIGCGRGDAALTLARAFPASRIRRVDLSEEAVAAARREAARRGLANAVFDVADPVEPDGHYDLIAALGGLRCLARPDRVLLAAYEALHDDGLLLAADPEPGSADPTLEAMLTEAGFTGVETRRVAVGIPVRCCTARKG